MSSESNKVLVRNFLEGAWNRGDIALIHETLSPDYITHESLAAGQAPGPDFYKQIVSQYRTAFIPFFPRSVSNVTLSPSLTVSISPVLCTKISSLLLESTINPNPFASLKNFTTPVCMCLSSLDRNKLAAWLRMA